jgi:hypothetical protein
MGSTITNSRSSRLPTRFPVGTRYVIEGRGGRIQLRYLEFPDGRQIELPSAGGKRTTASSVAQGRPSAGKSPAKKSTSRGTPRRLAS